MDNSQKYHFFWKSSLSQWKVSFFKEGGVAYNCAEQYMMHKKALLFNDSESAKAIMNTSSPREQQAIGRTVKNFNLDTWNKHAREIVYQGNILKFGQNPDLLQELLATGDKILVEASPIDSIWGIGLDEKHALKTPESEWKGTNWLGEVLTRVKQHFHSEN